MRDKQAVRGSAAAERGGGGGGAICMCECSAVGRERRGVRAGSAR